MSVQIAPPASHRLRVLLSRSSPGGLQGVAVEWQEIEANHVQATDTVLVFSLQTKTEGQPQMTPQGIMRPLVIESKLTLVAQAINGVLHPLVWPVPEEEGVLALPHPPVFPEQS